MYIVCVGKGNPKSKSFMTWPIWYEIFSTKHVTRITQVFWIWFVCFVVVILYYIVCCYYSYYVIIVSLEKRKENMFDLGYFYDEVI